MSCTTSDKSIVSYIISHCYEQGVKYVVISPGSRNAPLILSFPASGKFHCLTIVDERSAAYFALGLARKTNTPVALICTSGTAVLNYGPALAEAYYQQVPLIAITADRPPELIDQADGQTIRQNNIFNNFIRYQCQLPVGKLSPAEVQLTNRLLNEAFRHALGTVSGPVHINVPFREPLYDTVKTESTVSPRVMPVRNDNPVDYSLVEELNSEISQYQKILFLVGATRGESLLNEVVALLAEKGVVVVTETLSNLSGEKVFENTDRLLEYFSSNVGAFCPDLLITLDVPVLSKRIKQLIRSCHPGAHWHFSNQDIIVDTYQCLTRQIRGDALATLKAVSEKLKPLSFGYMNFWETARLVTTEKHREFCSQVAWSDFKVFEMLSQSIPDGVEIHLGNSTPVRYAQLFEWKQKHIFEGNRGTSGIDGCVSTAAGAAFAGDRPVTLIVGDLSFLYDSNGLWHRYLPATFRIIVINNGGGGIFRYIPGPSETKELEPFFEAKGDYRCKGIAETFGLLYFTATNADELMNVLSDFWEDKGAPALLEIFTPGPRNGEILRGYFNYLRSD